jgi:hypothetical protein
MSNNYVPLKRIENARVRARTAERLLALREDLSTICNLKSDKRVLLATWNIRDFDSNKFGQGPRLEESFFYIAEIISAFDLVAVQEVSRDLTALNRVMQILGREWDYIATDTTEGPSGNAERMVFVYNTEKVWFRKIAGEVVLPKGQTIVGTKTPERKAITEARKLKSPTKKAVVAAKKTASKKSARASASESSDEPLQFARTPFLVAFQSGWFRFSLCTVHIYYGAASGPTLGLRIDEIAKLAQFFAERQDKETRQEKDRLGFVENYILLGDFNVVSPEHETMQALKKQGFVVPPSIDGDKVRKEGDHYYDQIAARVKDTRFKVTRGGIYDMYSQVFRDRDFAVYKSSMPKKDPEKKNAVSDPRKYYRKWRTWQMSDHKPLWVAIDTDFADDYIRRIVQAAGATKKTRGARAKAAKKAVSRRAKAAKRARG